MGQTKDSAKVQKPMCCHKNTGHTHTQREGERERKKICFFQKCGAPIMKFPEENRLNDIQENEYKVVIVKIFKKHKKDKNKFSEDN